MESKKWDFMHGPTKEPEPIKWTSKIRVMDNEVVAIHLETGVISIYDIGNPKGAEVDENGNVIKLINLAMQRLK